MTSSASKPRVGGKNMAAPRKTIGQIHTDPVERDLANMESDNEAEVIQAAADSERNCASTTGSATTSKSPRPIGGKPSRCYSKVENKSNRKKVEEEPITDGSDVDSEQYTDRHAAVDSDDSRVSEESYRSSRKIIKEHNLSGRISKCGSEESYGSSRKINKEHKLSGGTSKCGSTSTVHTKGRSEKKKDGNGRNNERSGGRKRKDQSSRSRSPSLKRSRHPPITHTLDETQAHQAKSNTFIPPPVASREAANLLRQVLDQKADSNLGDDDVSLSSKRSRAVSRKQPSKSNKSTTNLPELVRKGPVYLLTVRVIEYTCYDFTVKERKSLTSEALNCIRYVGIDTQPRSSLHALPESSPQIDTTGYLFSAIVGRHGYDREMIVKSPMLSECTLMRALHSKYTDCDHSLDRVFRAALKELVREVRNTDETLPIGFENPVLISGRYLELRLIDKIRSYYSQLQLDIISFLTTPINTEPGRLSTLASDECKCKKYLIMLLYRYSIKPETFDSVMKEPLGLPSNMRVWTSSDHQRNTGYIMYNAVKTAYEDFSATFDEEDRRKDQRLHYHGFQKLFNERVKHFLKTHDSFLAEVLKASELFCWICFGVTMNEAAGLHFMGAYYYMLTVNGQKEYHKTRPGVCWNYPLATEFCAIPSTTSVGGEYVFSLTEGGAFDDGVVLETETETSEPSVMQRSCVPTYKPLPSPNTRGSSENSRGGGQHQTQAFEERTLYPKAARMVAGGGAIL